LPKWSCSFCDYSVEKTEFGRWNKLALGQARSNHLRKHGINTAVLSKNIKKRTWGEQERIMQITNIGKIQKSETGKTI
jgi:hypothetical protein